MRDSCIFYRSFYEAIKELPSEDKAILYDAIFSYSLDFIEPILIGIPKTVFTLIKPQIDANIKRYKTGLENGAKGAEFGKTGGRPKLEETPKEPLTEPVDNPQETPKEPLTEPVDNPQETPKEPLTEPVDNPQETPKEPSNVNDNENVDDNENKDYVLFVSKFNEVRNSKFSSKSKKIESSFNARIKEGYTIEKIIMATKTAMREKYHIETKFRHITPEFMTRIDKLEKYAQTDIGTDGSHVGFYKNRPIVESNGRIFIHIGEGVEYIYPPKPDTTGWTDEEKYNYFTCDRYDGYWSDLYKKAMDSQMNTTEKEKRGIYKWFYNQETLRFKEANHRNVRTS